MIRHLNPNHPRKLFHSFEIMTKLIVIIGITGNQGSSVASTFLADPTWRIRGLTRNPSSPASRALSACGVEMLHADLHVPSSLKLFSAAPTSSSA
jgi:nucleoside-diphosphate-sugar epimerase